MMVLPGGQACHGLDVLSYKTEMTAAAGGVVCVGAELNPAQQLHVLGQSL
jgi:hypothetical protein